MNPAPDVAARYRAAANAAGPADAAYWRARRALRRTCRACLAGDPALLVAMQAVQDAYGAQQATARALTLAEAALRPYLGSLTPGDADGCE